MPKSIEIHLIKSPDGMPHESDFTAVERNVADVRDGEIQIQKKRGARP
jgi:NADPH-dependent curcumin reductase CurA